MNLEAFFANRRIFLLIVGILLVAVLLFLIRIFTYAPRVEPSPAIIVVPRASETLFPTSPFPSVTLATPSAEVVPVVYTPGELKKDYDRITQRKPLAAADQAVRTKLINSIDRSTGIVETSSQFQVEYLPSPDLFMVEIRSVNVNQAKLSAEQYFKSQGLSNEGLCSLPVVFYLGNQPQNNLISNGKTFNPVPSGC